jgi:predicted Fe-Mo cluster-binding NifX family protein
MKIAVPVTRNSQIDEHFGHCESYNIFTISEQNEIANIEMIPSLQGCGCKSNVANTLAKKGVKIMLTGGIGAGAINVLNASGIEVIRGCSGDASSAVKSFLLGNLNDSGESCHQHDIHHSGANPHQCNH